MTALCLPRFVAAVLAGLSPWCALAATPQPIDVPMSAAYWRGLPDHDSPGAPNLSFVAHEGFPQGILVVKAGRAVLQGLSFSDGVIEYDFKPLSEDIPGIQFRRQGEGDALDAEEFYVRTFPDCRASDDCIQYAPNIHGFMLWNSYPQYQTHAFILPGWNHIKLVVSGRRMNVYVNGLPEPAMVVGELEGTTRQGGLALRGPADYANLVVTPGVTEHLPPTPTPDPTAADRGMVRHWQLGPLTPARFGAAPTLSQMPADSAGWRPIQAERFGLVNLNRAFAFTGGPVPITWLRFHVVSQQARQARVELGWLGQVWVFANGRQVTTGKNYYYPESERRAPDGRLSLQNGSFPLPLQAGENVIVLALHEAVHDSPNTVNHYGWGVEMRFDDPAGLRFTP